MSTLLDIPKYDDFGREVDKEFVDEFLMNERSQLYAELDEAFEKAKSAFCHTCDKICHSSGYRECEKKWMGGIICTPMQYFIKNYEKN